MSNRHGHLIQKQNKHEKSPYAECRSGDGRSLISDSYFIPTSTNSTPTPSPTSKFFYHHTPTPNFSKFRTPMQWDSDSNKSTKNALRLHSESDKKRHTATPLRSKFCPSLTQIRVRGVQSLIFPLLLRSLCVYNSKLQKIDQLLILFDTCHNFRRV